MLELNLHITANDMASLSLALQQVFESMMAMQDPEDEFTAGGEVEEDMAYNYSLWKLDLARLRYFNLQNT